MATSQPLGLLLQYSCRSLASLALGLYTSWSLSLVTLAGFPIFSMIVAFLSTRMKSSIVNQQAELTQASKIANNAIASIDSVKCLNGQGFEVRNFANRIEKSAIHYIRQARLNSLQIAFIRWMVFGMFVQGFWYGSSLARAGKLSAGEVLRTFWACLTAAQSIEQVLPQMIVIEKGKIAGETLKAIVQTRAIDRRKSEMKGSLYPIHCEGDIEVNNVSSNLLWGKPSHIVTSNIMTGVVCIPKPARNMRSSTLDLFLPCGRDDLRDWQKWLRQKHAWPASDALLPPNIRRNIDRWKAYQ